MKKSNSRKLHHAMCISLIFMLSVILLSLPPIKSAYAASIWSCSNMAGVRTSITQTLVLQRDESVLIGDREYTGLTRNISCSDVATSDQDKNTLLRVAFKLQGNTGIEIEYTDPSTGALVLTSPRFKDSGLAYAIGAYVGGVRKYISGQLPMTTFVPAWGGYGFEIPLQSHDYVTGMSYYPTITPFITIMPSHISKPKVGTYTISGIYADALGSDLGDIYTAGNDQYNMTINIIESACSVKTFHNINITWPALSPWTISEGEGGAENKVAPITINCGSTRTPTKVTVTADNILNATNGMINTTLNHLGLALTWASNGQRVPLNQELSYSILGDQDLSIAAKPMSVGSTNIPAGDFNATVTMSIEYR